MSEPDSLSSSLPEIAGRIDHFLALHPQLSAEQVSLLVGVRDAICASHLDAARLEKLVTLAGTYISRYAALVPIASTATPDPVSSRAQRLGEGAPERWKRVSIEYRWHADNGHQFSGVTHSHVLAYDKDLRTAFEKLHTDMSNMARISIGDGRDHHYFGPTVEAFERLLAEREEGGGDIIMHFVHE